MDCQCWGPMLPTLSPPSGTRTSLTSPSWTGAPSSPTLATAGDMVDSTWWMVNWVHLIQAVVCRWLIWYNNIIFSKCDIVYDQELYDAQDSAPLPSLHQLYSGISSLQQPSFSPSIVRQAVLERDLSTRYSHLIGWYKANAAFWLVGTKLSFSSDWLIPTKRCLLIN